MTTKTYPFDPAKYLTSPESQTELINDALASGSAEYVAVALGTIARARGMSAVARKVGVSREGLYKALSDKGDPKLTTFLGVLSALKIEIAARPAAGTARPRKPKTPTRGTAKKAKTVPARAA